MDVFLTGFPKKLLVAIALVVIIAMFITPTEARPQQRRRHKNPASIFPTKDSLRPHSEHNTRQSTKDMMRPKKARVLLYNREYKKIFRKLKNTKSFFNYPIEKEMREYKEMAPRWMPSVNFVDIHFHDYCCTEKNKKPKLETKFKYIMPKLYKSLFEYEKLFKVFLNMELDFPDLLADSYKNRLKQRLMNTSLALYSTVQEVNDSMTAVNLIERPSRFKDFSELPKKVNYSECIRHEFLIFRGYSKLLNNWVSELRCLKKNQRPAIAKLCNQREAELKAKMDSRKNAKQPNKNRKNPRGAENESLSLTLFMT